MRWFLYIVSIILSGLTAFPAVALMTNVLLEDSFLHPALVPIVAAFLYPFAAMSIVARAWNRNLRGLPLDGWLHLTGLAAGGIVLFVFVERSVNDGDFMIWIPIAIGGGLLALSSVIGKSPPASREPG